MTKSHPSPNHVASAWITLLGTAMLGAAALGLDGADLTFYAPFDGSLEPIVARGDASPQTGKKLPTFQSGVLGRAVVVGDPEVDLSYAVKDNLDDTQGTLSVWMQSLNWSRGDAQQHCYMVIPGRWLFYHYWEGGTTCFYWMRGSRVRWGVGGIYQRLEPGTWVHLATTWDRECCTFYVNGRYKKHRTDRPDDLPSWTSSPTSRFLLAPVAWTKKRNNRTAFDELMIFRRPLSPVEIKALWRRSSRQLPTPYVRIAETSKPPIIDGKLGAGEWDEAAGVTGFLDRPFGNLTRRDVRARMAYDAKNLYILVESDATVEVRLASAVVGDARLSSAGEHVTEMAIPFAAAGIDPASTKMIRLNIITSWSKRYGDWASWADTFGEVELGGEAPVLRLNSLGQPHYARLDLNGSVVNPNPKTEQIQVKLRLQPTDLRKIVDEKFVTTWTGTVIDLDAPHEAKHGVTKLRRPRTFQDTDINSVLIEAIDGAGKLVYRQQIPFVCTPPIVATAKTYPKQSRVDVVLDVSEYREAKPSELAADIRFRDAQGKELGQASLAQLSSAKDVVPYELSRLPTDQILVHAMLKRRDGSSVATSETSFSKLAPGPWLNSKLGLDDVVIDPFEPIRVDGQRVSVWGRTYVWDDSLLPVAIHTNGAQVLAAPIELYAGEKPAGRPNQAAVTITEQSDTTVRLEARSAIAGVPIIAKTLIEYDGMVYTELSVEPEQEATLPSLRFVIPMKSEHAWLYHYFGRAGAIDETENRRGPFKGERRLRSNMFWLGTPDHGLTWFCTSRRNWRLRGNADSVHVKHDGPVTTLTGTIAKSSLPLTDPLTIDLGLIATPVRKMRINWRFFRCKRDWTYSWFRAMTNSNNHVTQMVPDFPETVRKIHQEVPLYVAYIRPDWINLAEPESAYYREEWQSDPWYISGTDRGGVPGQNKHLAVCLGSDWQDFLLHHEMKIIDAAKGDGFYHDGADPIHCKNRSHGHGYRDEKGKWQHDHTLLDYRRYYKRLAVEMHKRKGSHERYLIWLHQSNHFNAPAYSFANMGWDGEQFSTAATSSRDYTKLMTPEYFLAEFHGKQFGYPVQWLGEFFSKKGQPPITTKELDTMLCLALITGTQELILASNLGGAAMSEYAVKVLDTADAFGLRERNARFIGWWENSRYLEQAPPDHKLKCSLWDAHGKVLLVLGNANSGTDRETTVTLKPQALGLTGKLTALDWWTKRPVPMQGNRLTVSVKGSSWRLIAVVRQARASRRN